MKMFLFKPIYYKWQKNNSLFRRWKYIFMIFNIGLFDGDGTLSSNDNKFLYNGEFKDGLKHGTGN